MQAVSEMIEDAAGEAVERFIRVLLADAMNYEHGGAMAAQREYWWLVGGLGHRGTP
jgi:hypothetical protein